MKSRNEVLVGVVILLAVALTAGGTLWLKGADLGRDEVVVRAQFREVGQLTDGNPVKLRGVPIGRVTDVRLAPGGDGVVVAMTIDASVPLPQDPVVLLAPQSLFGDWQAEILPRARYPEYAYAESPDPQVLPGYSLPDISQITAVADRIAENIAVITERVDIAFTEETAHNIRRAIENIQAVSDELTGLVSSQQQAMEELTGELATTTRALGQAAEYARRSFSEVDAAVGEGELAEIMDNVHRSTAQMDSLSRSLVATSRQLQAVVASADRTFGTVESVAARVEAGEGTLGQLVRDTTLYRRLLQTNELLQVLLQDIQDNPKKYIHLEIF